MKIGYIRVSRDKQTTALQEDAMQKEHCERVFIDKMSHILIPPSNALARYASRQEGGKEWETL